MVEFRIGRGHDGPARLGEYIIGEVSFETPLLVGPEKARATPLHYRTLSRDPSKNQSTIVAIPFGVKPEEVLNSGVGESDVFLLPSMPSFSSINPAAGNLLLQNQLNFVDTIKESISPSRMIIRVPENTDFEDFESYISEFHSRGVHAAAFIVDEKFGSRTLHSIQLRSILPASWLTLALGTISPDSIPLLYYVGFDIFDCSYAHEAALNHTRLWRNDIETIDQGETHRFCSCIHCVSFSADSDTKLVGTLQNHNLDIFTEVLSESVHAMQSGRLRWLVESMTHVSPNHASLLRQVDAQVYDFIEEFTPTTGADVVPLIGPESYNAPVVRRYREYLESRYSPPSGKKIVLLLPCSARKPYSDSKSHRRLQETIETALGRTIGNVAEVILTSPLGVVPRELERVFPAANYDIPVTGDWDAEETALGAQALTHYLNKIDSDVTVVAHVSGGYLGIVKGAEDSISQSIIYTTPNSSATSWESRQALHETLVDLKEVLDLKEVSSMQLEEILRATADFQFGSGAGSLLVPENVKIRGKPYRQIVCKIDKEQVCSFIAKSGSLSLTLSGGKRLTSLNRYWVRLEAPEAKGGSVFAVGVEEADSLIRPGDEVIVLNQEAEVIAVGKSEMSGREMCELTRGRAVSLRHKREGS